MSTPDPIGDTACRVLARGRIVRRWKEGRRPNRSHVVLVEGPTGRNLVVAEHWWTAHEATDADVAVIENLFRRGQLYNATAVLSEPLESM